MSMSSQEPYCIPCTFLVSCANRGRRLECRPAREITSRHGRFRRGVAHSVACLPAQARTPCRRGLPNSRAEIFRKFRPVAMRVSVRARKWAMPMRAEAASGVPRSPGKVARAAARINPRTLERDWAKSPAPSAVRRLRAPRPALLPLKSVHCHCLPFTLHLLPFVLASGFCATAAAGSGKAVWYFTCLSAKLDLMLPTPGSFVRNLRMNSSSTWMSATTTRIR
jgi:hypothetical protein